ncbi:MAG: flagellar motor protein MotB, partial [Arenicellales bacterium]
KTPQALFRRLDSDYYYPTFGDDSTLEEDAPTSGKFYLKWQKDKNYGLWGNFEIAYLDNSLAHVDRGLYGGNLNYEGDATTSFGEKRFVANVFAAEPGTVAGRDEFLGTGGSLYYMRRQDILIGSDRMRIEVRDAVSGLVMSVKNLTYGLDYDIDYIQGRIMLREPLSATATSDMLVNSQDFGGNRVYLVANYEFTPAFEELEDIVTGGRAHYWFGDYVKLGMTLEDQEVMDSETSLTAYDVTLRKNAGTWLKLEKSTSQGPVSSTLLSNDGGFEFDRIGLPPGSEVEAEGQRLDASVRFEDIIDGMNGKFTFYNQQLEAGYSAPGLSALNDTSQIGGTLELPVFESVNIKIKADSRDEENALQTDAVELDVDYLMNEQWTFGLGLRNDSRTDNSANVALTQEQGERTDAALRATFNSGENWLAYGYIQDTLDVTGNREANSRVGVGGDYRLSDRFNLNGELSSGDLGPALKLGTSYKMTDATDIYSSYAYENERTDNGVKARRGNFATGFKTQYSDSASIYMEERYTHGDVPTGLTHTMGFDLIVNDRLNIGGNVDIATFNDISTGAENDRTAAGFRIGYKFDALTYAGALEYRLDETEQPNTSFTERTTWLMKNSIKYNLNPDWRLIGKLNFSQSESSLGDAYNGDFTEAVLGYAYRPVDNDKLNALFKYTYFYNLPTTDQLTPNNEAALYIQKSHVLSMDFNYDLTQRWTLGGKYAHRFGQLSLDRENPEFFDSEASLYILRADWHFTRRWDALVEGRMLDVKQAGDARSGVLLGVYRHLGDNIKLGVGYNFTDFSDDLTDLDYDSQGMFVNVIGKF